MSMYTYFTVKAHQTRSYLYLQLMISLISLQEAEDAHDHDDHDHDHNLSISSPVSLPESAAVLIPLEDDEHTDDDHDHDHDHEHDDHDAIFRTVSAVMLGGVMFGFLIESLAHATSGGHSHGHRGCGDECEGTVPGWHECSDMCLGVATSVKVPYSGGMGVLKCVWAWRRVA